MELTGGDFHQRPQPLRAAVTGVNTSLDVAEAVDKNVVVGNGFFDELLEQEHLGAVDDGVDALFESFHRHKGLKRVAEQDDGGMAALADGHLLQRLQREVFLNAVRAEQFLDDDDLVTNLSEAHDEIAVGGGGVNLVSQLHEGAFGDFQPFRSGKAIKAGLSAVLTKSNEAFMVV